MTFAQFVIVKFTRPKVSPLDHLLSFVKMRLSGDLTKENSQIKKVNLMELISRLSMLENYSK